MKQKTVFNLKTVELNNCDNTDVGIQYINHTPPWKWIFLLSGCCLDTADRTPVCKRECNEDVGKCKGIFLF